MKDKHSEAKPNQEHLGGLDGENTDPTLTPKELEQVQNEEVFGEDSAVPKFTHPQRMENEDVSPKPTFKTHNVDVSPSALEHNFDDLAKESVVSSRQTATATAPGVQPQPMSIPPLGHKVAPGVVSGHKKGKESKLIHLVILGLIGVGVIGATVYLLKGGSVSTVAPAPSPSAASPVVVATPAPEASPVVAIDRSKFRITVLNGTPKSGLAASVKEKLKTLGYTEGRVGNATNSAFARTAIRTKPSAIGLVEQLIKDLSPDFDATSSGALKDSDSVDGEVILGGDN